MKKLFALPSTELLAGSLALAPVNADACTRVVYLGPNADVITARSMDWNADIVTNLWIFPKGVERRRSWPKIIEMDFQVRKRNRFRL